MPARPCMPVDDAGFDCYKEFSISKRAYLIEHVSILEKVNSTSDMASSAVVLRHLSLSVQHTVQTLCYLKFLLLTIERTRAGLRPQHDEAHESHQVTHEHWLGFDAGSFLMAGCH